MIHNVVIHVANEQPLKADLFDVPAASDAGLVCTNVRTPDGKKPLFIEHGDSTFFFPYHVVRFLEIPSSAMERHLAGTAGDTPTESGAIGAEPAEPASNLPVIVVEPEAVPVEATASDDELELELDEDFLQRIRDI